MAKIKITQQGASHQYDSDGNAITDWNAKKCAWIVRAEYENDSIVWWGDDNDFPSGYTLEEYEETHPDWNKHPDIEVTWTFESIEIMKKAYGAPRTKKEADWYASIKFPYSYMRNWGYIDYTEDEAIERLGKFCDHHKHSITRVSYNGEIIFEGKL
jgi:hypothetical protein